MPVITELLARLGVDSRDFERKLKGAEKQLQQTSKNVASINKKLSIGINAVLAGLAVREVVQTIDAYTNLQNRLRAVTDSEAELTRAQKALFQISRDTRSSVEANVELFSRLTLSTKELGTTQDEILDFTKSLNQAIKLSGATAAEAQAGILQLSQGMASGALRGDELRSVLEQLPAVADVIAKQMGATRGELRELGSQGRITADIILDAFKNAREELEQRFGKTVPTIAESLTLLNNAFIDLAGAFSEAVGAGESLSGVITNIADGVKSLADRIRASGVINLLGRIFNPGGQRAVNPLADIENKAAEDFFNRMQGLGKGKGGAGPKATAGNVADLGGAVNTTAFLFLEKAIENVGDKLRGLQTTGEDTFFNFGLAASDTLATVGRAAEQVFGEQIPVTIEAAKASWSSFSDLIAERQEAFSLQATEAWASWIATASDAITNVKLAALDFFQSFSSGFGNALAQVIVFQEDFQTVFKNFLKNLLAQVIQTLTEIVVQWILATILQYTAGTAAHIARVGQALQLVYLNAFAATAAIPIVGPALAPGVASGSVAAASAGSIAASALGGGVGSAGSAALGLATGGLITNEGLALLHPGEVVATPEEVKTAMTGEGRPLDFSLSIDGRLVARYVLPHIPRELRMRGV